MLKSLWIDEQGVILSAELVLIATILVLGMIVGLVELQVAVVSELADIASAFGNLDQSFRISGFYSAKENGAPKARTYGSQFFDGTDDCDCEDIILVCSDAGEKRRGDRD